MAEVSSDKIIGVPNDDPTLLRAYWRNEFERCEDMMDERRTVWRKARKNYRMAMYTKDDEDGSRQKKRRAYVRNPILYTNVTILLANLAANKPLFTATARYKKDDITASMVTAALDYYTEHCDCYSILKKGVLDAALNNIAIAKIGYNLYPTYMYDGDSPFITRVSPYNFLVDPDATCSKDARWMGEKSYMSLKDLLDPEAGYENVEQARRFATTFRVNEEIDESDLRDYRSDVGYGSAALSSNFDDEDFPYRPSLEQRIPIIEIYDRVNREALIFAGNCEVLISKKPYPEYVKDFPYSVMQFNEIPDYFMGQTDYEIIIDKIKEVNTINNRILEQTKRMIPKLLARKGAFSKAEMDKIVDGKLGGVNEVDTPSPLGDVVMAMPTAPLDQSNFYSLDFLKKSMNEDTGIADFQKSQPLTEKRTATELAMVQQASAVRANYRQKSVDMWLEGIATRLFYVLKHTMKAPVWIDIAGSYPNQAFDDNGVPFIEMDFNTGQPVLNRQNGFWLTPDVMQSEFRIKIEAGSTAANTSTVKQNQIMQAYSMFANNQMIDQAYMTKQVLAALGLDPESALVNPALMQGGMGTPPPVLPPPMQPNGSTEIRPQQTQMEGVNSGNALAANMRGM